MEYGEWIEIAKLSKEPDKFRQVVKDFIQYRYSEVMQFDLELSNDYKRFRKIQWEKKQTT